MEIEIVARRDIKEGGLVSTLITVLINILYY